MPVYLILDLDIGLDEELLVLNKDLDLNLLKTDMFHDAFSVLEDNEIVYDHIDDYLLYLMSGEYFECMDISNFDLVIIEIRNILQHLYDLFKIHQLYIDNVLTYRLSKITNGKMLLLRRDVFYDKLKEELNNSIQNE